MFISRGKKTFRWVLEFVDCGSKFKYIKNKHFVSIYYLFADTHFPTLTMVTKIAYITIESYVYNTSVMTPVFISLFTDKIIFGESEFFILNKNFRS